MAKVDPFYAAIGERIREVRKRQSVSQEDLAAHLELEQRAVSDMENGRRKVQIHELLKMAQFLGTPYQYLLQDVIDSDATENLIQEEITRLSTAESRKMALDILRAITARLE